MYNECNSLMFKHQLNLSIINKDSSQTLIYICIYIYIYKDEQKW